MATSYMRPSILLLSAEDLRTALDVFSTEPYAEICEALKLSITLRLAALNSDSRSAIAPPAIEAEDPERASWCVKVKVAVQTIISPSEASKQAPQKF